MLLRSSLIGFVICARLLVAAPTAQAENWPQWRGPDNDGISPEKNLPARWSDKENVVWKLEMPGMASSTPAVWGEHIFLTSQDGGDLVLMSVSTAGKEEWRKKIGSGANKFRKDEGNEASASPSTDGKHVYAFVASGNLVCYSFDGQEVWNVDLQKKYGKFRIQFGMHSTPVLYKDRLYLQIMHDGGQQVIAIDKGNGEEIWKVDRKSDGRAECLHSYASAVMWHKGKDAYLVVHGNDYSTAHDLKDGSEIWRLGDLNPKGKYNPTLRFVATPVATPDLIVVPTAKRGPVVGVKPDARGSIVTNSTGEQWRLSKGTPDVPSPLVYEGLVYLCGEQGSLMCLDAHTGESYYDQRIFGDRYRASPVYVDGKIICTSRQGVVTVVKAGKNFEVLSTNRMNDDVTASPGISNGRIYIRGWKYLYAIGSIDR